MPRAVVVTHLDQPRGDFDAARRRRQRCSATGAPALRADPRGRRGHRADRPARSPGARGRRDRGLRGGLIEAVITESEDDGLLDRYLGGEEVGFETVVDDLETAVAPRRVPSRAARRSERPGSVSPELLEVICRGFPSPVEHVLPPVYTPAGADRGPVVRRAPTDRWSPRWSRPRPTRTWVGCRLVRVFSGTLLPDVPVHVSGHFARFSGHPEDESWHSEHDLDERAGAISRPLGADADGADEGDGRRHRRGRPARPRRDRRHAVRPGRAGRAVAVDRRRNRCCRWRSRRARPARRTSSSQGLARLQAEDPTVRVEVNPATEQLVMWVMGEQQLDVLLDRLRGRAGIEVAVEPVRVACGRRSRSRPRRRAGTSSSPAGTGSTRSRRSRSSRCPRAAGSSSSTGWSAARCRASSSRASRRACARRWTRASTGTRWSTCGSPSSGGKAHSVDSSDAAFQMAGSLALREASVRHGVHHAGAVRLGHDHRRRRLRRRRAERPGLPTRPGARHRPGRRRPHLGARRGAAGRAGPLRRRPALACHGTGIFTRSFAHYEAMPEDVAKDVVPRG